MKITDQLVQSITIKHGRGISDIFSDLRPGDKITAKIVSQSGNSALLEFRGSKITADFLAGVPSGGSVELVLREKTPERIAFIIAGKPVSDEFMKLLLSISLLPKSGFDDLSLHNFMKFLGNGKIDLLNLNLFLTGIKKEEKDGKSQAELFNFLLKKGISYNTLADLSMIFAGKGGTAALAAYYMFAESGVKNLRRFREGNLEDVIDGICRNLADDEGAFTDILSFLIEDDSPGRGYGDIAVPEGEGFSRLRYIRHEGAFFFDMEFSAIGRVSALIKGDKSGTFISIFSDNDDIVDFFIDRGDILKSNLEMMNVKKPFIMVHNSKKMIDKLDVCRTDFYIKREFDVKV